MTENKRYKVAIYDEKAISGYCVLDLEKPSQTARLKYNNVFIGTKEGCDIVCELLNEQEERIKELELENAKHIGDGEWDIRDITYGHGKFRLEEWGERYHQFYDGDKPLEDETVVSLLFENDKLKQQIETKNQQIKKLETENEWLKQSNKNLGKIAYPMQQYNGDVE